MQISKKSEVKVVVCLKENNNCSRSCSAVLMVSTTTQLSMPATGQTWSSVSSPVLSPRLLEVVEVLEVMDQTRR